MACEGPTQMGPGGFFPTNPDLADILGRTDFDFDNFYFWDFLGSQLGRSQLGPGPDLKNLARLEFQRGATRAWQATLNATCHMFFHFGCHDEFPIVICYAASKTNLQHLDSLDQFQESSQVLRNIASPRVNSSQGRLFAFKSKQVQTPQTMHFDSAHVNFCQKTVQSGGQLFLIIRTLLTILACFVFFYFSWISRFPNAASGRTLRSQLDSAPKAPRNTSQGALAARMDDNNHGGFTKII